jgi:4-hydroxy-tetrahydrodipicolinate synthase
MMHRRSRDAMSSFEDPIGAACALVTAFRADGTVDAARTAAHARRVLDPGCTHVGLFGTTGEGPSLGVGDRAALLDAVLEAGVAPDRIITGVGAASVAEAAAQWRLAAERGAGKVLLLPPFYYKGVDDAGLGAWFDALFAAMGPAARNVILYTIPGVTGVALSPSLIAAIDARHPGAVIGVKDSSGSLESTLALVARLPRLQVLVGHEAHIADAVRRGASGSISGAANFAPEAVAALVRNQVGDERIDQIVAAILAHPVTAAVKAIVAHVEGDPAWYACRPPLVALAHEEAVRLGATFDTLFAAKAA